MDPAHRVLCFQPQFLAFFVHLFGFGRFCDTVALVRSCKASTNWCNQPGYVHVPVASRHLAGSHSRGRRNLYRLNSRFQILHQ